VDDTKRESTMGRIAEMVGWLVLEWVAGAVLTIGAAVVLAVIALAAIAARPVGAVEPGLVTGGPNVSTQVENKLSQVVTSASVGTDLHDVVTVSGALGTPTGQVALSYFENGTCSGSATKSTEATLSASGLDTAVANVTAFEVTETLPKLTAFQARYLGNSTYAAKTAACEPITWVKATPGMTFQVENVSDVSVSQIVVGQIVHSVVTMSGPVGTPTGTVTFEHFLGSGCSGTSVSQVVTLAGTTASSNGFGWDTVASESFLTKYGGDASYLGHISACINVAWIGDVASLSLRAVDKSDADVQVFQTGSTAFAKISVSGSHGTATGTVTISGYTDTVCGQFRASSTVALVNGGLDPTDVGDFSETSAAPVTHSWRFIYNGDSHYAPRTSPCIGVTWRASAVIRLASVDPNGVPTSPFTEPEVVHVVMTVSGGFGDPTGQVEIDIYSGSSCVTKVGPNTAGSLTGGTITTPGLGLTPGSYSAGGAYGGDSTYFGDRAPCIAFSVVPPATPSPTLEPTPSPTGGASASPTTAPTPTLAPGQTPGPTTAPGATSAPGATTAPGGSLPPGVTPPPGVTSPPGGTLAPGQTLEPGSSAGPVAVGAGGPRATGQVDAAGNPLPGSGTDVDSGGPSSGVPVLGIILLVVVITGVGVGAWLGRRRRA